MYRQSQLRGLSRRGQTRAPTVISFSPENNSGGIAPNAVIVVTFSTAMDQSSVEAAWSSADLPPSTVTFSWNATGEVLTVTPNQPLPIATGTGLDPTAVVAEEITFAITTDAMDAMGSGLAAQLTAQFTTLRRLTYDAAVIDALTQGMTNDNMVITPASNNHSSGDTQFNDTWMRCFLGFTLPTLPGGAVLTKAELSGQQTAVPGTPYTSFGNLKLHHVNFPAFDASTFGAVPIATQDFSTSATLETKTVDVTARVLDDYANASLRGNRSQYRLQFPVDTNANGAIDRATFSKASFRLRLTYEID